MNAPILTGKQEVLSSLMKRLTDHGDVSVWHLIVSVLPLKIAIAKQAFILYVILILIKIIRKLEMTRAFCQVLCSGATMIKQTQKLQNTAYKFIAQEPIPAKSLY